MKSLAIAFMALGMMAVSCNAGSSTKPTEQTSAEAVCEKNDKSVEFNADSAYNYIKAQVDCGPRVPGTDAHRRCAAMLVEMLKNCGADTVLEQKTVVTAFNGDKLPINNILARYNTENPKRILLVAHWDTRPWADAEKDASKHSMPIPGANDGGSGVGVLLEIARNFGEKLPSVGVDILLTDAEDYGQAGGSDESWCLGTQYWVRNMPYQTSNLPVYGILLDIVGGLDAHFCREYFSDYYASAINDKVWAAAAAAGYASRFVNSSEGAVTDDHIYINKAGIPCIDIIECANQATGSFPPTWHTLSDDMKSIDRTTLKAVGQTVINVIYNER